MAALLLSCRFAAGTVAFAARFTVGMGSSDVGLGGTGDRLDRDVELATRDRNIGSRRDFAPIRRRICGHSRAIGLRIAPAAARRAGTAAVAAAGPSRRGAGSRAERSRTAHAAAAAAAAPAIRSAKLDRHRRKPAFGDARPAAPSAQRSARHGVGLSGQRLHLEPVLVSRLEEPGFPHSGVQFRVRGGDGQRQANLC